MLSPSDFADLVQFVGIEARPDVRRTALQHLLGTTASLEGVQEFARDGAKLAITLAALAGAPESGSGVSLGERRVAVQALTNACAENPSVARLLAASQLGRGLLLHGSCLRDSVDLHRLCVNVTASQPACSALFDKATDEQLEQTLDRWVDTFLSTSSQHWNLAGALLTNATSNARVRGCLIADGQNAKLNRICAIVLLEDDGARKRRGQALGIIRNCCFDTDLHSKLTQSNNVALSLLWPVAAGNMVINDSEMEDIVAELQYLPEEKSREKDAELRQTILEAIYQLCATAVGREHCRSLGAYYILREWHKHEIEPTLDKLLGDVINVLIRTEDEMGADNLKSVPLDGAK